MATGGKTPRDFNTVNLQWHGNNKHKHSQEFEKYKNYLKNQKPEGKLAKTDILTIYFLICSKDRIGIESDRIGR